MLKEIKTALLLFLLMVAITGVVYPMLITGAAKAVFPAKASGSLLENNGKIIGSELIGQQFTKPEYFHPRPSKAGNGYDAMNSGGSNLSPTSKKLEDDISARFKALSEENPGKPIPTDLLTASASGLDPHISVEAAFFQMEGIAEAREVDEAIIKKLIEKHTEGFFLGVFGEPRVNVLLLNINLDRMDDMMVGSSYKESSFPEFLRQ